MVNYSYSEEGEELVALMEGPFYMADAIAVGDFLMGSKEPNSQAKLILDFRKAKYNSSLASLSKIYEHQRERKRYFTSIREAIVTNSPLETALGFIYGKLCSNSANYQFKVFSAMEGALGWLSEPSPNASLNEINS